MIEHLGNARNMMKRMIVEWNICIAQCGAALSVFDFPTVGYTRKASLIADFERSYSVH